MNNRELKKSKNRKIGKSEIKKSRLRSKNQKIEKLKGRKIQKSINENSKIRKSEKSNHKKMGKSKNEKSKVTFGLISSKTPTIFPELAIEI